MMKITMATKKATVAIGPLAHGPGLVASPPVRPRVGRQSRAGFATSPPCQDVIEPSRGPTAGLGRPSGQAPHKSCVEATLHIHGSCQETAVLYFLAQHVGYKRLSSTCLPCQLTGRERSPSTMFRASCDGLPCEGSEGVGSGTGVDGAGEGPSGISPG